MSPAIRIKATLLRKCALLLLTVTVWLLPVTGRSQLRNAHWMEYSLWLSFQTGVPVYMDASPVGAGKATLSDTSGQLLVYWSWGLDGGIHGPDHALAANHPVLTGSYISRQGAYFVPRPMNPSEAFLVTPHREEPTQAFLRFGILRLDLGIGNGQPMVLDSEFSWFMTNAAGKAAVIPHSNGSDYWCVVHGLGSNQFHAFQITSEGISGQAVLSSAGVVVTEDLTGGKIIPTKQGNRFISVVERAVNASTGPCITELFGFDLTTGQIAHQLTLPDLHWVMGVEFSPNGRYLYVADRYTQPLLFHRRLFQYDLESTDILASRVLVDSTAWSPSGMVNTASVLALAPDGRIYVAHDGQGTNFLGVINAPDQPATACDYVGSAFEVPFGWRSFPTFIKRFQEEGLQGTSIGSGTLRSGIQIMPNPLEGTGLLNWPGFEGELVIQWLDGQGRMLRMTKAIARDGRLELNATGLAAGQYLLRVVPQTRLPQILRVTVIK